MMFLWLYGPKQDHWMSLVKSKYAMDAYVECIYLEEYGIQSWDPQGMVLEAEDCAKRGTKKYLK